MSAPKPSRMVADRIAITHTVTTAIGVHAPEILPTLESTLFPTGVPKDLTVGAVIGAFKDLLQRRTDELVVVDRAHTLELADDDDHRAQRDERIEDLKSFLVSLRASFTNAYSAKVAAAYGLGQAPPDDTPKLILLANNVEALLRSRPLAEPPRKPSLKLDPIAAADDIKSTVASLQSSLDNVERERREAQVTLGAKTDGMAAWGTAYSSVAEVATAAFILGGRADLAERLRPTARRRAGLLEPDDAPAETSEASPPSPENTP